MEHTEQVAESEQINERKPRRSLVWSVIALAIIVILIVLFFLLRGCTGQQTTTDQTPGQPSTAAADSVLRGIENKVHLALHSQTISKDTPLCSVVYVIEASEETTDSILATIKLTQSSDELVRAFGADSPVRIATTCENAVLGSVTEVTTVKVVDKGGNPIASAKEN